MSWIILTLSAVIMQTCRNALQSKLSEHVSTSGVTLARFIVAPPIALIYLVVLYFFSTQIIPDVSYEFIVVVLFASVLQIAATSLMVILFKQQNFAVGAGLAKSEALVAGVVGTIFFGSQLSIFGWIGIFVGAIAVLALSGGGQKGELSLKTICIGLGCGTCFALTSLFVREASYLLNVPFPHNAAWVLLWVLCIQTSLLVLYIAMTNKQIFLQLKQNMQMTVSTSVTSCLGSICWFSAMALQHVAYVKTLGQIEVLFTILIAVFWFKQVVKKHELIGLSLIALAAILVMWA